MPAIIASKYKYQIRQAVGHNLGLVIVGAVSTTGDTTSLIDTYGLGLGGTDEYKGSQIIILTATQAITGQKSWVTGSAAGDATIAPALTLTTTALDTYEMWCPGITIEQINSYIDQAEVEVIDDCLIDKESHSVCTEADKYIYDLPSGYEALYKVEWEYAVDSKKTIHACDVVFDELVDGDVTATADTTFEKEGNACLKLVVAAGASANDILATDAITSLDLSDCDEVTLWIYSTATLAAGAIQLLLDNTASCASPVETLNIPATTANTWTKHVIALANPYSDSAIISVGIKMITDTTFTLFVDNIEAVNSKSRQWKEVPPEFWDIWRGSTDYLRLNSKGLALCGTNKLLSLSGYQKFTQMSADSSTAQVDPDFIIARVTEMILLNNAMAVNMDTKQRMEKAAYWSRVAEAKKLELRTQYDAGVRFL